jgi:uncharacterized protein (DUF885 family)
MKRNLKSAGAISLLALCGSLLLPASAQFHKGTAKLYEEKSGPARKLSSTSAAESAADRKFATVSETFMFEALSRAPATASQAGYHKHVQAGKAGKSSKILILDAMLDDMSAEFMAEQIKFYSTWRDKFAAECPPQNLSAQNAADAELLNDQIALSLLELEKIQNYKHNPTVVVEMIGSALFQPLTSEYAPRATRVGHVLSRVEQIPRVLNQVKQYLDSADPIFVSTAIAENAGNVDLIETTIKKEVPKGNPLRARYDRVAPAAISALKSFSKWLETDLGKRPNPRSWRLGEFYPEKFKLVMETDLTSDQLLANAEKTMKEVRQDMLRLALPMHEKMFPSHGKHDENGEHEQQSRVISEVLDKIGEEHPKRDLLLKAIENDLAGIKQFIRQKKIVTLSDRENLKVIETPLFMRGIYSGAGFHSAPPLEPKSEAQYWVTPIDAKTPEAKAESRLRENNNYTLKWLTIHEALPGHYIQFEHLNNIQPPRRRLLRSLFANGPYVEGWAEYIAQVMMDEGFMGDEPKFRLIMRKIRMRLLANTILDVRMHTMNYTDEEAMRLMTDECFQTQAEAEAKLTRAKLSSTQLPTYYAGLVDWLALREKYQKAKGKNFDLLQFHNLVLDQGPLPVPIVERLIMP